MNKSAEEQAVISKHMSSLGKKAGAVNKRKGSEYFKWVRAHGKQKKQLESSQSES